MGIDIEKMRRRNEKLTAEAKRLEFDILANSAMEDKKQRFSQPQAMSPPISIRIFACSLLFLLLILLLGYASHLFIATSSGKTAPETLPLAAVDVVDAPPVNGESNLDNAAGDSSSFSKLSSNHPLEITGVKTHSNKQTTAMPVKSTYSQKELRAMPPDVRAEVTGR